MLDLAFFGTMGIAVVAAINLWRTGAVRLRLAAIGALMYVALMVLAWAQF